MITVPEATEKIIKRSRYLSEAISKGIINSSSLARYIKPEIEQMTFKKVSQASVIMALNRLSNDLKITQKKSMRKFSSHDVSIQSDIFEVVVSNSNRLSSKREDISRFQENNTNTIIVLVGKSQTSMLAPKRYRVKIVKILEGEEVLYENQSLAAITVKLSKDTLETPGAFYSILKSFAWEEINIIDVFSTYLDFTVVIEEKDIDNAFSIIKSLFNS
jgi:hypothetical protein